MNNEGACQKHQQSASPAMAKQGRYCLGPGKLCLLGYLDNRRPGIDGQDQEDPEKDQPFFLSRYCFRIPKRATGTRTTAIAWAPEEISGREDL